MSRAKEMGCLAMLIAALASTAGAGDLASPNPEPTLLNDVAETEKIFANGFESFTLAIDNFASWCSVSVDGGVASSASSISNSFPEGKVVSLHAGPISDIFVWGYWTGTDADFGANDTNQTTEVTMSADRYVFACCPFPAIGTCP